MKKCFNLEEKIKQLQEQALIAKIPIISNEGLDFLFKTIKNYNVATVLEIGGAIGYSSIAMALKGVKIDSFERNSSLVSEFRKNISDFSLEDKIVVLPYDALEYKDISKKYDLIFIDAAKAQYQKFFIKYKDNLSATGVIVADNLNFHNLQVEEVGKRTKRLLMKLQEFKNFLKENDEFKTEFYSIGDGMSLSRR